MSVDLVLLRTATRLVASTWVPAMSSTHAQCVGMKRLDLSRELLTFATLYAERGGALSVPFLVAAGLVICRRLGRPLPWGTVVDAPTRFDRELAEALQLRHVPPRQWLERDGSRWKTVAGSVDVLSEWAASLSDPSGGRRPAPGDAVLHTRCVPFSVPACDKGRNLAK